MTTCACDEITAGGDMVFKTGSPAATEKMRLTSGGNILVRGGGYIEVTRENTDGVFQGFVYSSQETWHNPRLALFRARGTSAGPLPVQDGDQLATIDPWARAPDNSWQRVRGAAGLTIIVDGMPVASAVPAKAVIGTLTVRASGDIEVSGRRVIDNQGRCLYAD